MTESPSMLQRVRTVVGSALPRGNDYDRRFVRADLVAGLTVAVVALPLALGFGLTSGAGATAGLVTAIVAGFVAALLGGSQFQVSGPTGAMTAVLLPLVATHGPAALPALSLMAGLLLLLFSVARIGRYISFVPWPVIAGFTNGIAVIILLQQLPGTLGTDKGTGESILLVTWNTLHNFVAQPTAPPALLALAAIAITMAWPRRRPFGAIPGSVVALVAGTLLSLLPFFGAVRRIGEIPRGLPAPHWPSFELAAYGDLFRAALAVAVLSALESLLSAVVADGMTIGERHDPDRELFGQGIANIAVSFFGGIPATAALARTAVNVRSGARTRLAAMTHAVGLLLIVLFLAPFAARIPLAVLSGILSVVAFRMVEREAVATILRSTRSDAFVLVLTTAITVLFDLILAIEVGLVSAGVLFTIRMSNMFSVDLEGLVQAERPATMSHEGPIQATLEHELLARHVVAYRIDGPIFFGAARRFFDLLAKADPDLQAVILRMRRVPIIDATGLTALRDLIERLERSGTEVYLSGLNEQPHKVLERTGLLRHLNSPNPKVFAGTDQAIQVALARIKERLVQDDRQETKSGDAAAS